MIHKQKPVLITGATGLVGSYLLKVLLQNRYKVYVLSRSKDGKNAKDRVIDILKFWDNDIVSKNSHNLSVLEGDITKKNLGLNKQSIDLLKNEIEEIFHCAAITEFNYPLQEIRKVNVEGTKNILDLALECKRFKKVSHISTAYVCGDYKGIFKEEDFDVGQKFNTTYEQSKFEAEKLIQDYRKKGLWIDIFRPPIILGDSKTGKVLSFKRSFYQFLHALNLEIFNCFPNPNKENYFNIVFVDELCQSIICISSQASIMRNKNYHPFSLQSLPFESILDLPCEFLGLKKPSIISSQEFIRNKLTPAQMMLLKFNFSFLDRDAILDSTATNELLRRYNFKFSNFDEEVFLKLLEYCVKEGFLHKK